MQERKVALATSLEQASAPNPRVEPSWLSLGNFTCQGLSMPYAFLELFFEKRPRVPARPAGTNTFTKTREDGGDTDVALEGRRRAAAGTSTLTEARENSDTDVQALSRSGTMTRSASPKEDTDSDQPTRRGSHRTASQGTQTSTRAREDADADATKATAAIWGASVI